MKIERVLVAVDFSETAVEAARYAAEYLAPDAEVILLHVIDPPRRPRFAEGRLPREETLEAVAREFANAQMQELSRQLGRPGVRTEVRIGKPYQQVAAVASEIGASLVVIGPHGDRPRPSRFLGTTADRVVRTCPIPVLVATNASAHQPRHILVPVDDDAIVESVMAWTRTLAEQFGADVSLLHVWSNAVYSHVASMSSATTRTEADARKELELELSDAAAHWLRELARTGLATDHAHATVAYGNAGDVTVETAASAHADLIILGRHGSHLAAAALLGSTVGTVLHGARCPVLVVTR